MVTALVISVVSLFYAQALPLDTYADASRLSQGRWVRIAVENTGMHLISDQQLRQWGFSDPAKVKVYGYGADRLPNRLDTDFIDDLPQTPSEYIQGRGVVFFGVGPVSYTNISTDYLRPVQNPFTTVGYYFLTADDTERLVPQADPASSDSPVNPSPTFREVSVHEQELVSPGYAGYLMVGEDFKYITSQKFKLPLPGIDLSQPVAMESSFVAKALSSPATLLYTVDGNTLPAVSGDKITQSNNSEIHAIEGLSRRTFDATSDNMEVMVTFTCNSTVALANLNYIAVTYSRRLDISGGQLTFWTSAPANGFSMTGAASDVRVWDVTTPLKATAMNLAVSGDNARWSLRRNDIRRFAAWNPAGPMLTPRFADEVANQNLHAHPGAEMVIFTPTQWRAQAEKLADLHRNDPYDPISVVVLTPQEIYNEFASGMPDVQAFRKLLKMFYDRQKSTDTPLRYALFMSRPVCDIRRVTDYGRNLSYPFLPAWFTDKGLYDNDSYFTDDIMGFLEDRSGSATSSDKLSIAVGRIPVTSTEDAQAAVDKINRYYTRMPRSNWKNNILVTADDGDQGLHMDHAEWFTRYLSESNGGNEGFVKKVYIDEFARTSNVCEEARQVFYRYLDEGAMLWFYTGHANSTSITHENLVTYTDLNNMYLRHWPVVYGATCNLMRWDSPSISGAEILFKNPNGGVIAAITATRAVYIPNNGNLSASFGRHFLERGEDGRYNTLGEIYRLTKNDFRNETTKPNPRPSSDSNKLRYALLGDPALRLAIPSDRIILDRMAGVDLPVADNKEPPCLMARQQTTVSGYIMGADGQPMTSFNGNVLATIYDAEKTVTTKGAGDDGVQYNFEQQGGRLFFGNARVENGRFTININMPSEVENNYRNAAISLYAYDDNGGEAVGAFRDFYVFGTDEEATPDLVPPTIEALYINHPTFVSGGEVNDSPMVIAEVTDDRAINLSTAGIGHQMGLYLDNGSKTFNDVADYFTPYTDGRAGGTIRYPLEGLAQGAHTVTLRVWDTAPNAAEASVDFFVTDNIPPTIYNVYTDANPASVEANFYVSHDRPDRDVTVTIEVFDMMGRRIWQATQSGRSDLFETLPITWDLTDYGGHRVVRGIYLYRATISDATSGEKSSTASRRLAVTAQ